MLFYDPLLQYEFLVLNGIKFLRLFFSCFLFDIVANNIFFFNLIIYILINLFFTQFLISVTDKQFINLYSNFHTIVFKFINDLIKKNVTLPKKFLFYIFFIVFLLILLDNLIGLIPFTYTITSSFIITITFSFLLFLIINIIAIYKKGLITFINLFLPNGTPKAIIPLLILIESVSYLSRVFSLAIRLFANMMAGHTLLKILIAFTFIMVCNSYLIIYAFLPWILITLIFCLEILISLLQAYVFIILSFIYLNDIQKEEH